MRVVYFIVGMIVGFLVAMAAVGEGSKAHATLGGAR